MGGSYERVRQIAERVGGRDGQVLLRWCVQRDLAVVMKIFDFTLSSDGMAAFDALDETGGTERALERRRW